MSATVELGAEVALVIDGETIRGQVWARCPEEGWVWVALAASTARSPSTRARTLTQWSSNLGLSWATFVALNTRSGIVRERPGGQEQQIGRIAA